MRRYSDKEKKTIQNIVQYASSNQYVLANAYNDIFYARNVEFNSANGGFLTFWRQKGTPFNANDMLETEHEIIETSLLLEHLDDEGLIYIISDPSSTNQLTSIGGFNTSGLVSISKALDPKISQILLNSLNHRIFVNHTLKELVENNFLTFEEQALIEAKKQTKQSMSQTRLSFAAVVIAIISVILSWWFAEQSSRNMPAEQSVPRSEIVTDTTSLDAMRVKVD